MRTLVILLMLIACNDQMPSRGLIEDAATDLPATDSPTVAQGNGNSATVISSYAPPTTVSTLNPRCQSHNRCLYQSIPVYNQSAPELANYIGRKLKISHYEDPGLCVPTSAAMLIKAMVGESHAQTQLNHYFLESLPSKQWTEVVYRIGVDSGTDFINGGTWVQNWHNALKSYLSQTKAKRHKLYHTEGMENFRAAINSAQIISAIKDKKFIYVAAAVSFSKEANSQAYTYSSGHALVIKGFDGDRLHIQDPWGMDYFTRISQEDLQLKGNSGKERWMMFQPISYSGFLGEEKFLNRKVGLDVLSGVSLE